MILTAARRTSDGLLTAIQSSPSTPDEAGMIAKGAALDNTATWEMVTLTQQQFDAARTALPARSFLNGDVITSATPPMISAEITDVSEVTVTADVNDAGYEGLVSWTCISPDGVTHTDSASAVAGVDTWVISTGQQGEYLVRAETELHGVSEIKFGDA